VITAAGFALATALVLAGAPVDGTASEGPPTAVTGRVESVRAEEDGRVPVAVRPQAQMYFLHRSEPHFEDLLRLLKDAQAGGRPVRCTFRRYSGRIVAVEWADQDDAARAVIPDREEAALWKGTAQVDVMIWEPGGEHPYATTFDLVYREAERTPFRGADGVVRGHEVRLVPVRIATEVSHEVRHTDGRSICRGGGHEMVTRAPEGRIAVAPAGATLPGFDVPVANAYQLVLPRAVGAFACGTKKNARDRRVVIGTRLFDPVDPAAEIEVQDSSVRRLDSAGLRMTGVYESSDAPMRRAVRHDYRVRWELHRQAGRASPATVGSARNGS
jgi:hypothetical protein